MPTEACLFTLGKRLFLIKLLAQWFQSKCNNTVGALKVKGLNQLLYLARSASYSMPAFVHLMILFKTLPSLAS